MDVHTDIQLVLVMWSFIVMICLALYGIIHVRNRNRRLSVKIITGSSLLILGVAIVALNYWLAYPMFMAAVLNIVVPVFLIAGIIALAAMVIGFMLSLFMLFD